MTEQDYVALIFAAVFLLQVFINIRKGAQS